MKCKTSDFFATYRQRFDSLKGEYSRYQNDLEKIKDSDLLKELTDRIGEMHEMCANAFESCEWRLFGNEFGNENTSDQTKFSQDSTKSNKSASLNKLMREIELEKRQAEIDAEYELARARVKKECEEAKIKAEQKLLNRSERCLSASSRGESVSVQSRRRSDRGAQASKAKLDMDQSLDFNAYEV